MNRQQTRYRPDAPLAGAQSQRTFRKRYLPVRSAEPPRPATSIATLRCEIVSGQAGHKLTDALPADKGKAVTVSSRLLSPEGPLSNRQLTVLVYTPPAPQGESIIAREREYLRDRQCPESAIIT